jgi:predicted ATPase/DNA-binding CsgD family transcriptional regulator
VLRGFQMLPVAAYGEWVTMPFSAPAGSAVSARHNLPAEVTRLIGREQDIADIKQLAARTRLLTLSGAGGIGKTRLALRVAAELLPDFPDGGWLVQLAPVTDSGLVTRAVAATIGVRDVGEQPQLAALVTALASRRLLLVLDNCEHVIGACAGLVETLLRTCPGLRVLVTSREPVRVPGEVVWRVRPLALPPDRLADPEQMTQVESVALFAERAGARRPGFIVDAGNADAVAAICRRLGGLPLAVELAAAQVEVLSPQQIAERLDGALRLLTGGDRMLPRQETLRASLGWSHALLTDSEQLLFRRLAVFAGAFTVEAAERVCGGPGMPPGDVLPVLVGLVGKSLAEPRPGGPQTRYVLLEPVRQYAREQLIAAGEMVTLERHHARYYMGLAEGLEPALMSGERAGSMQRLAAEQDNLRAALAWSLRASDPGDVVVGLRLAGALGFFWNFRGEATEGLDWLEALLARGGDRAAVRAKALYAAAELGWLAGRVAVARAWAEESEALWRAVGDKRWLGYTLQSLPMAIGHPRARESVAESLRLFGETGDAWGAAMAVAAPDFFTTWADGDAAASEERHLEQGLLRWRELGDPWGIAQMLNVLGDLARAKGDDVAATARYSEALTLLRREGLDGTVPSLLHNLGYLSLHRGDTGSARRVFRESLALFRNQGDRRGIADCITGLACVLVTMRQRARAAQLFGLAEALRELARATIWPSNAADYERSLTALRSQPDQAGLDKAWAEGRALPVDRTIAELLAEPSPAGPAGSAGHPGLDLLPSGLTRREREVAMLVAEGLTNREIGARLFITEGTARLHVKHILHKLGFTSRAQVAAWAAGHQLTGAPPAR